MKKIEFFLDERTETMSQKLFKLWKYLNIAYIAYWLMFVLGKGDKWYAFNVNHPVILVIGISSIATFAVIVIWRKKFQKK